MRALRSRLSPFVPLLSLLLGIGAGLLLHAAPPSLASAGLAPPLQERFVPTRDTGQDDRAARSRGPQRRERAPVVPPARDAGGGDRVRLPHVNPDRPVQPPVVPPVPEGPEEREPRAFAGLENLQLQLPHGVRAVGFHESGDRRALPMHPMGIPRMNGNLPRVPSAPVGDGFEYLILPTRGRWNSATSAVDISIPHNTLFTSPVTGTVVDVQTYALYGSVPDNMVMIRPDSRPDLTVVIMHLNGVRVTSGQRVTAGQDVIALTARQLPFASQIDRFAGSRPHAHIEVRRS